MSLLFALLVTSAQAGAPTLAYKWAVGQTVSYRVQYYLRSTQRLIAGKDLDARLTDYTLGLETDCKVTEVDPVEVELHCAVRRAQLGGRAYGDEQPKLDEIFVEYSSLLAGSTIQLVMRTDGTVRELDLEGLPATFDREVSRNEALRMMVRGALAPLEFVLPKDGSADKAWKQKGSPMALRLPAVTGTSGGVRVTREVTGVTGDMVDVSVIGAGTVVAGDTARTVSIHSVGTVRFDAAQGVVARSEMTVTGTYTASGSFSTEEALTQVGMVERVEAWPTP